MRSPLLPAATLAALLAAAAPCAAAGAGSAGSLDPAFGDGGVRVAEGIGGGGSVDGGPRGMRILADGRIVVVRSSWCGMACRLLETGWYSPTGALQRAVALAYGDETGPQLEGSAVGADGSLYAGFHDRPLSGSPGAPWIEAVGPDGERRGRGSLPWAVAPVGVVSGGRVVGVAGRRIVRLRRDLTPDPAFGTAGAARVPAGIRHIGAVAATASAVRVAGSRGRSVLLQRIDSSGRTTRVGRASAGRGWSLGAGRIVLRRDGAALVTAAAVRGTRPRTAIAAFLPDGRRDRRFGTDGLVLAPHRDARVALRPDGRIVVVAIAPSPGWSRTLVVRGLTPRGRPDPGLPPRRVPLPVRLADDLDLAVDRRGRIVAAVAVITRENQGATMLVRLRGVTAGR